MSVHLMADPQLDPGFFTFEFAPPARSGFFLRATCVDPLDPVDWRAFVFAWGTPATLFLVFFLVDLSA